MSHTQLLLPSSLLHSLAGALLWTQAAPSTLWRITMASWIFKHITYYNPFHNNFFDTHIVLVPVLVWLSLPVFQDSLTFCHNKIFQTHLYFLCPSLIISYLSKESFSFFLFLFFLSGVRYSDTRAWVLGDNAPWFSRVSVHLASDAATALVLNCFLKDVCRVNSSRRYWYCLPPERRAGLPTTVQYNKDNVSLWGRTYDSLPILPDSGFPAVQGPVTEPTVCPALPGPFHVAPRDQGWGAATDADTLATAIPESNQVLCCWPRSSLCPASIHETVSGEVIRLQVE